MGLFLGIVRTNGIVECGLFMKHYAAVSDNVTYKNLSEPLRGRWSHLEKFLRDNLGVGFAITTEPGRMLYL